MQTWLDIEARFRSLAPALRLCRLDAQWGAAGEYWRISGTSSSLSRQEYELLCGVAGRLLEKVLSAKHEEESKILAVKDPAVRWYQMLKNSPAFGNLSFGEQLHEDGSSGGFIYTGSLSNIGEAAANLCLAMQISHPVKEPMSTWRWVHDNYLKALLIGAVLAVIAAWLKGRMGG